MFLGVTDEEYKILIKILSPYKDKYSFYLYGSRVKGTHEKTSDLDVLVKGEKEISISELADLKGEMDSSRLSYIVNFCDYNEIDKDFFELIKKDLVKIL